MDCVDNLLRRCVDRDLEIDRFFLLKSGTKR